MPLRDHFRPPLDDRFSWEWLHGQWPAVIVKQLYKQLTAGFIAEPRAHYSSRVEVDLGAFETDESRRGVLSEDRGGVATAVWAPSRPSLTIETALPGEYDEYEVRIFDPRRGRHLVAVVEIVSPANKDRPRNRKLFVAKCAAMLQKRVAVSIVDLVTVRQANLYVDLLDLFGHDDPTLGEPVPPIYAASCRWTRQAQSMLLEAWSHPLSLGQPLPTLPLWLAENLVVPLDLESSYEQACRDLRIS